MKTPPFIFLALLTSCFASALIPRASAEKVDPACNRVRFQATAPGKELELVGGVFQGSNTSRYEGYEPLVEIKEAPVKGQWGEIKIENKKVYRWVRFVQPKTTTGKIAKVEFYTGDLLLGGEDKGMKINFFKDDVDDTTIIGYDLFYIAAAQRPAFFPADVTLNGPTEVTIKSNPGATIRYTLDGTWPTAEHGETYTKPIRVEKNTTFSAMAISPGQAPGLLNTITYLVPEGRKQGLKTAGIGNSLTGTTSGFARFARTAGYDQKTDLFLRPGALTREQWALATGEYAKDKVANAKEELARKRGSQTWEEYWKGIDKVDVLTLQPRDFDLAKEIDAEINFIKLFQQKSPEVQPWLYCEWVEQKRQRPSDRGDVPSYQMKKTFPALTWEESMSAMLLYVEELQHRLTAQYSVGKRPRILPSALAMGWMKNHIDSGKFPEGKPGMFYPLLFHDQVHPAAAPTHGSANGGHLVDLTWYAAFYKEAPEGKVLPIETTYTPAQAKFVEKLAWDVIKNYPDCGLYEEGKEPCGKPEFANDGKRITLKSSTPGAWFRYTLDGTEPTRTRGYVYCGVISVQPGIQVKAVAYKSGMADSVVNVMAP
ncbi:chitobiase/beta-hexosaminidase C-terminal domain-containing protein [Roseimicrobium sp. ORNL1]|uniref:chitobiase/beta-hexosaminidase C-terminal domain-containing protein n=1 Tax=Roseimicrobium sp. ORNL1 TaxID=2711231 RepID=UPI0013E132DE|nr:chitobiase/beta-hexosaminidase C-terminal domain-containing protein [Roseimicrobium sp. ORNL1]QIF00015.1 hypothetical protein G5S37_00230 [Roseimicrobium sp. ORNL1]